LNGSKIISEEIFKSSKAEEKRFIQVKTRYINNNALLIAVCTDITSIKSMERENIKLRSQFFCSVAHELRTPLNSIIPILKMLIDSFKENRGMPRERLVKLINIVYNSSIHLQSVIEDAMDLTRFENNKFTIF
jgi:signal transduction histidine kinase